MGRYKHDPDKMASSATTLENLIDSYNDKLQEMQNLINDINNSPAWKDMDIKTAFNKTCNDYMKIYNNNSLNLSFNVKKLKEKARCTAEFDQAYMERW